MKKVESFDGVDGIRRNWATIEAYYYQLITNGAINYRSPYSRLQNLIGSPEFMGDNEAAMLEYLIANFETIIKAQPNQLVQISQAFIDNRWQSLLFHGVNNNLSAIGLAILDAFSYERLRSTRLIKLASIQNIKACLYCNSQFTLVINNGTRKLAKFQFDHFFPKKKHPYLSISLYNLIPSCASCNQCKTDRNYGLTEIAHPYYDDFQALTQFEINLDAHNRLLQGALVPENEINVYLSNMNDPRVHNQNSFTAIESIYKRHTDIVKEIYLKAYAYRNGGKEALMNLEHNGERLFASEDEIEWLLLANYKQVSDINKRPLAKFMQDIAKQAGLISS